MEVCPICGHRENLNVQKITNAMYQYTNKDTGKVDGVYNDDRESFTVVRGKDTAKEVTVNLVRSDKYVPSTKPAVTEPKPITK